MPDLSLLESTALASLASLLSPPVASAATQKFLRFQLHSTDSLLIAVDEIVAVQPLTIAQILPVPQMNPAIMGICSWRGELIWLVDLAQQTKVGSLADQQSKAMTAIVVQSNAQRLGIVVPQVYDIEQYDPNTLLLPTPHLFSRSFIAFVQGYFPHRLIDHNQYQRSVVLSVPAVFQDSVLHIHGLNSF